MSRAAPPGAQIAHALEWESQGAQENNGTTPTSQGCPNGVANARARRRVVVDIPRAWRQQRRLQSGRSLGSKSAKKTDGDR